MAHVVLCFHNHQPYGNFDHVFEAAWRRSYLPLLKELDRAPHVCAALHFSGSLLQWLATRVPSFVKRVRKLVERGQVELVGGPFYEAILPLIPDYDVEGQIATTTRWLHRLFGVKPTGLWLPERVWEPGLIPLLSRCGVEYILLDDTHLLRAGVDSTQLASLWTTERQGYVLKVVPISRPFREKVPLESPEEVIHWLRRYRSPPGAALVYGDDGEKLGLWPGAFSKAAEQGWLAQFFDGLSGGSIKILTPGRWSETTSPVGRVAIPAGSYAEMGEWALPPESWREIYALRRRLGLRMEEEVRLLREGYFEQFLQRYVEIDDLHKKMIRLSSRVAHLRGRGVGAADLARLGEAQDAVWRSQGNDVYWHGMFCGVYSSHLRHVAHTELLRAEVLCDGLVHGDAPFLTTDVCDFDRDGQPEISIQTRRLSLMVNLAQGAILTELGFKPRHYHLTNVCTRRPEAYHPRGDAAGVHLVEDPPPDDVPLSHPLPRGAELAFDGVRRGSFQVHLLPEGATLSQMKRGMPIDRGDFAGQRWEILTCESGEAGVDVRMCRSGRYGQEENARCVRMIKDLHVPRDGAELSLTLTVANPELEGLSLNLGLELDFNLLAEDDPLRRLGVGEGTLLAIRTCDEFENVTTFHLEDRWCGVEIRAQLSQEARLWTFPLDAWTRSEGGVEHTFQGTALVCVWPVRLWGQDQTTLKLNLRVHELPMEQTHASVQSGSST